MKILAAAILLTIGGLFFAACGGGETSPPANVTDNSAPPPVEDTAQKLDSIKQQGFSFVYVFRRKDSGKLDADDKKFLRANSPSETNQWIVTDEGTAAIAGSNYMFPLANLEALRGRFNVEDLSPPREPGANVNVETPKGATKTAGKSAP